jgi:hypothetical protein
MPVFRRLQISELELTVIQLALEEMRDEFSTKTTKVYPIENDRVVSICDKVIQIIKETR